MMRNTEKVERLWSTYREVCKVISCIKKDENLGNYPLLNAVSNLQILLKEGFGEAESDICKLFRQADEGKL